MLLTPSDDVKDQDDKTKDATASAILPGVLRLNAGSWGGEGKGRQPELEKVGESWGDHGDLDAD